MQKKIWLLALAMVGAALLSGASAWADSEFYVIAGGGGVGTKITSVPYEIKNPGFYYLTGNLNYSGSGNAITVLVDNVTIDLMGFTLTGPGNTAGANGISLYDNSTSISHNNVEVRNGTINNFSEGLWGGFGLRNRAFHIRATNNFRGIWLYLDALVEDCHCSGNTNGIYVWDGTVSGCRACNNSGIGIQLVGYGNVIDNVANNNTNYGFWLSEIYKGTVLVDRNSATGNGTNYYYDPTNLKIAWGVNAGK